VQGEVQGESCLVGIPRVAPAEGRGHCWRRCAPCSLLSGRGQKKTRPLPRWQTGRVSVKKPGCSNGKQTRATGPG
jgi:hypothetical protein